jgi:hypothetical protein
LVATSKVEFAHVTAVHDADASGGAPQQQPQRMFSGCSTGQGYYSSGEGNVRTSAVVCFSEARGTVAVTTRRDTRGCAAAVPTLQSARWWRRGLRSRPRRAQRDGGDCDEHGADRGSQAEAAAGGRHCARALAPAPRPWRGACKARSVCTGPRARDGTRVVLCAVARPPRGIRYHHARAVATQPPPRRTCGGY